MKNFIIFGAPGAGKGTQADLLTKKYKLAHLSSGELLRQELKGGELEEEIKKYVSTGRLVPGKIINQMMANAVEHNLKAKGFIFDGFPRTIGQAKKLDRILKSNNLSLDAVFELRITETEGVKRILERAKTSGRSDDNVTVLKKRFKIYNHKMHPIVAYYRAQKKMIIVDGQGTIKQIFKELTAKIKSFK